MAFGIVALGSSAKVTPDARCKKLMPYGGQLVAHASRAWSGRPAGGVRALLSGTAGVFGAQSRHCGAIRPIFPTSPGQRRSVIYDSLSFLAHGNCVLLNNRHNGR